LYFSIKIVFCNSKYTDKNYDFLAPVYEKLFRDIGEKIDITKEYREIVKDLDLYFKYLIKLKKQQKISLKNKNVDRVINRIDKEKLSKATESLSQIIDFIIRNRTNVNGLEVFCWSLLSKTSLEEIKKTFVKDINFKDNIRNVLLSFGFNSLLIEYPNYYKVIIEDLLIPVELKNPKRRQGLFDKEVFKLVSIEFKKILNNFLFEEDLKKININFLKENTNWLVTEKTTKNIDFPLPNNNSKKIDMLCKIENSLFIGTHKEQQSDGGAQDNQAVDAGFIFNYETNDLEEINKKFNVKNVYLMLFLERGGSNLTSKYWKNILDIVGDNKNKNKYLLSSAQFIDLIKEEFEK